MSMTAERFDSYKTFHEEWGALATAIVDGHDFAQILTTTAPQQQCPMLVNDKKPYVPTCMPYLATTMTQMYVMTDKKEVGCCILTNTNTNNFGISKNYKQNVFCI